MSADEEEEEEEEGPEGTAPNTVEPLEFVVFKTDELVLQNKFKNLNKFFFLFLFILI